MSKLSTGILINKIKLIDKIDCEIESAKKFIQPHIIDVGRKYFKGKIQALQDLKQWIEDLE